MIDQAQLKKGRRVEQEHKATYDWIAKELKSTGKLPPFEEVARHIALDHLDEHADYYDKLLKAGL